jgi:hypothetical protein
MLHDVAQSSMEKHLANVALDLGSLRRNISFLSGSFLISYSDASYGHLVLVIDRPRMHGPAHAF